MRRIVCMPFGRFRGTPISKLPDWYLAWVADLPDLREPLFSAIRAEVEVRAARTNEETDHSSRDECPAPELADELIGVGVRTLAKKYHPDLGGSDNQMRCVNLVGAWLRRRVRALRS